MPGQTAIPSADAERRRLPVLFLLFVGSGCAALIYEIVWLQLLQLVIGSSAVSLGVLLGTFMGGMCLGSLALPRLISTRQHPLRAYALLELGIGVLGVTLWFALPPIGRFYAGHAGHGLPAILLRGLVCGICLLPPTVLMGATLPAISRWIKTTPNGVSWLGFFYGGNLAGAVLGCLLAGFYLLRVLDMEIATFVAAAINAVVAMIGFVLAASTPNSVPDPNPDAQPVKPAPGSRWVYLAIALSGMSALAAEVVWTRLLSLLLGGTVYTFSIILAVFLVGLGIGSSIGSFLARTLARPRIALGVCQLLLTGAITWSASMIYNSLPYWPVDPELTSNPWISFQLDLVRCLWAILPATCLWGASFPLALASVAAPGQDPARLVGGVYAANTVGAIIGALAASLVLIAWIGTQHAQQVLVVIAAVAAILMFVTGMRSSREDEAPGPAGAFAALTTVGIAFGLALSVPALPWELVAEGRYMATKGDQGRLIYMGEGMNASVAVTETADGIRNFHVSGKIEASTDPRDMRLQRMLGHLPALLHPDPRSVLVVGCGAGVTAGSFITHPGIQKIVICEIEPIIPRVVATNFARENYNVVKNPRVQVVYDDARNFVLTSKERFDIITSDPIHPWVKGAATLYTKEYFEMCRDHLNPGGFVTQWVPLYESNPGVVKSEIATFFEVFPGGTIWANDQNGKGYDIVLLGQAGPTKINVDDLQARLDRSDYVDVGVSLRDVGFKTAIDLLGTYGGRASDLQVWLRGAEINRDRNLRLQYLAGMNPNLYREEAIFDDMEIYRRYPKDLFIATNGTEKALLLAIERSKPAF
ncbi:MAG TPA: fused MFS/spermidine synthase [Verrucomicrobiae bacterium]|nr:fused MFS/spermidine synthase [Verrucomicrobiae bacterium]